MQTKHNKTLLRIFWLLLAILAVIFWKVTLSIAMICAGIWILGEVIPFIKPQYSEPEDPFYD
ncbi:MAG: hypothetical protein FVQ82_12915 [Planctomycetes bacterium]|nr:hypothetical protein [Planctomycetota bacterium]